MIGRQRTHRGDLRDVEPEAHIELGPYHAALATSPPMGLLLSQLGKVSRTRGEFAGSYSHAQRELVDQVLCYDYGWNGFLISHTLDGLSAGMRMELIEALRTGDMSLMNDEERLLVTYIRQVIAGTVTDATWAAVEQLLTTRGAVEYTVFILFLNVVVRMFQAFGAPEVSDQQVTELLEGIKSGTVALPDFKERIN